MAGTLGHQEVQPPPTKAEQICKSSGSVRNMLNCFFAHEESANSWWHRKMDLENLFFTVRAWMWAWVHACATAAWWNQGQLFRTSCFFPRGVLDLNSGHQVCTASTSLCPLGLLNAGRFKLSLHYSKNFYSIIKRLNYFSLSSLQIILCF